MAVYTDVSADELGAFIDGYDIGKLLSYKGIAEGVENSNFLLHTGAGHFILTLYEKRVAAQDLPFFLGLMEHLAARGITCPQPVKNRQGEILGKVAGRPAAIVTFLDGMWMRRIDARHCQALGEALAGLHLAGADFPMTRKNALSVEGWRPLYEACVGRADSVHPGMSETIENELTALEQSWPRDLPTGVIHADLFPDNVFFLGDKLSGLIDFYFACNDSFAYDVSVCLNAWCFEPDRAFNATKARALLQGYSRVRPLSDRERELLPLLARGSALRFLMTRLYDWVHTPADALVKRKDPQEYLARLRFHRAAASIADYGL
jgi:homoserine kinase type II